MTTNVARSTRVVAALALGLALAFTGCKQKGDPSDKHADGPLPALRIGDETPNLMLTWIDGHGGTHVEISPNRVPDEGRRLVRVIVTGRDEGMSDPIYVTDLTSKGADGTYATRSMTRHEWENEIERRRGALAALPDDGPQGGDGQGDSPRPRRHPSPHPGNGDPGNADPGNGGPGQPDPGGPGQAPPSDALKNVTVTIYGASWCGPCHMALDHLKHLRVATTFKDVDKDPGARDEMSAKLSRAGQHTNSIPVIDVGGRILVGYDERALDQALERAAGGTAL